MANEPSQRSEGKNLGDYDKLGRGAWISAYRAAAGANGLPKNAGGFERLKTFSSKFSNWGKWIGHVMKYVGGKRYPFQTYKAPDTGVYPVEDHFRLSIAGDWGTGTDEAQKVMEQMSGQNPDFTIHLGDVYYVGDSPELKQHCLGEPGPNPKIKPVKWKGGTKGSFALAGNHEMYALGTSYFQDFLPVLGLWNPVSKMPQGQKASFFCLKNRYWKVVGLDTGYYSTGFSSALSFLRIKSIQWFRKTKWLKPSCKLPDDLLQWLPAALAPESEPGAPLQGLILLSHHQYYSGFDDWYVTPAEQLQPLIKDRTVLWWWGHEHRMAVYDQFSTTKGIKVFGRCIGHGGMPVSRGRTPDIKDCNCLFYDNRKYQNDEQIDVGYNGYVNMTFDGPKVQVDYLDLHSTKILTESWTVDKKGKLSGPVFSNVLADGDVIQSDPTYMRQHLSAGSS